MIEVEWDLKEHTNEAFWPLVDNRDRYLILYGGRGSSKSDFITKRVIHDCLNQEYYRLILCREVGKDIKDSMYQSIKDTINELGLGDLFRFRLNPLEIECINGNKIIARGRDEVHRIKSVKDPTGIWYEEEIPTEADFNTITTSVRTTKGTLQEIFTINPEVHEGKFEDNWFYKKFFTNKISKSFSSQTSVEIEDRIISVPYTAHHSTHLDNKFLPDEFRAILMGYKDTDEYYYTIYTKGEWGNRKSGGNFYKQFNRGKLVANTEYDPQLPLHLTFDFNVNPYMSATIWQISNNIVTNLGEIAAEYPKNTTKGVCHEFKERYPGHKNGLFIYGDPSGKNKDTRSQQGDNDFSQIEEELKEYRPELRVARSHPSVSGRGKWINDIFLGNRAIKVIVSDTAGLFIADLMGIKEGSDGAKHKEKVRNTQTGVYYEKYGHFSDGMDYFLCEAFKEDFQDFQKRKVNIVII